MKQDMGGSVRHSHNNSLCMDDSMAAYNPYNSSSANIKANESFTLTPNGGSSNASSNQRLETIVQEGEEHLDSVGDMGNTT